MREIRLPDGSCWQLDTMLADARKPRASRRKVSQTRTWVWVRCTSGVREQRLMFAATWELWPDAVLARALEEELARVATRLADTGATASASLRPPTSSGVLGARLARGSEG